MSFTNNASRIRVVVSNLFGTRGRFHRRQFFRRPGEGDMVSGWFRSIIFIVHFSFLVAQRLKCLPAMWETWVGFLGQEAPLEKEMTTHSSILVWRIPWTEEPGGQQSTGSQRVGHNWMTSLSVLLLLHQLNFSLSGTSSQRLGTPELRETMILIQSCMSIL